MERCKIIRKSILFEKIRNQTWFTYFFLTMLAMAMIRSALVMSMVMSMRIWIILCCQRLFQLLDFFTECRNVRPNDDLLRSRQLTQSGLDIVGDGTWHSECIVFFGWRIYERQKG